MFILLSPAKRMSEVAAADLPSTTPALLDDTARLLETARKLTSKKLQGLMEISPALGDLTRDRFQAMSLELTPENARQAILTFAGDVYLGLDAPTLSPEDLAWAQDHVGILSGFYGLLRPMDLIQPYRLEMGTALTTRRGKSLYDFWGDRLTKLVKQRAAATADATVINLASTEYASAVDLKKVGRVVTPVFQEEQDGKARVLGFFAKKARGMMTRWAAQRRAERPEELQAFDAGGYRFVAEASDATKWVFRRPQPGPPGSED